jgi:hypothetical protein
MAAQINRESQLLIGMEQSRPTQEEMLQALDRVLSSKHFVHAPMKQKFLRLTCDFSINGRGPELNEYLIGREVFGRDDSYNPATDPIVRVGAHGVREKLALYYQKEGAGDEIRIEIPIGSYEPSFIKPVQAQKLEAETVLGVDAGISATPSEVMSVEPAEDKNPPPAGAKTLWGLGIAVCALAAAVVALLVINHNLREKAESRASVQLKNRGAYGAVWEPFLRGAEPTLLILSNPTVHRSMTGADPDILAQKAIRLTAEQAAMLNSASGGRLPSKQDRPLQLIPAFNMYTGIGEAIGVYRVSSLLQTAGEQTILKQSRSVGPEDLRDHDVIMLGSIYSNQWSKPLSIKENFVYTNQATIENLSPAVGEEREYKAGFDPRTGNLVEDYALITVTPGVSGERTVMVLAGIYSEGTEAAVDFVTGASHLGELNHRLLQLGGQSGPPRYYQALLKVKVENSFPTKTSLLTVRELQSPSQ